MLDLKSVPWRTDDYTKEFVRNNAAELAELEKMSTDRLAYTITFCDAIINPYSEEIVRRAGSFRRYNETVWLPWKIEIIKKALKGFGHEII